MFQSFQFTFCCRTSATTTTYKNGLLCGSWNCANDRIRRIHCRHVWRISNFISIARTSWSMLSHLTERKRLERKDIHPVGAADKCSCKPVRRRHAEERQKTPAPSPLIRHASIQRLVYLNTADGNTGCLGICLIHLGARQVNERPPHDPDKPRRALSRR